eukprot:5982542-Ditylum_brightwellii.AAC.1
MKVYCWMKPVEGGHEGGRAGEGPRTLVLLACHEVVYDLAKIMAGWQGFKETPCKRSCSFDEMDILKVLCHSRHNNTMYSAVSRPHHPALTSRPHLLSYT